MYETPGQDVISTITVDLLRAMEHSKLAVISRAVQDAGGPELTAFNLKDYKDRAELQVFPAQHERFLWDGVPLIEFNPMELKNEGGRITANQPYRLVKGVKNMT